MIKCQFCSNIFSKKYLKLHMQFEHHAHLNCIKYICQFKNCNRSFSDNKMLNKHKRCKHFEGAMLESQISQKSTVNVKEIENIFNDEIKLESEIFQKSSLNKTSFELVNISNNEIEFDSNDTIFNKDLNIEITQNVLRILALKMISSLHSDDTLSRIQIDRIMRIFHLFLNTSYVNDLKKCISLTESNSNHIIEKFEILQNAFSDLDSEYKRNKLLTNLGYYIKPKRIFFGTMDIRNENALKIQNVCGQLIPLKEILKIFFEIGDVFEKTCKYIDILIKNDNEIYNIIQTHFWKSKISNSTSITIPLFLYEDAFEIANPLGSHAGIYKLSGMYISIPCLPPELYSKLDNIFLTQLYHADDSKLFPREQIYSYLIKELMILETEGIQLMIESKNIQVYFKLALIIGDNFGIIWHFGICRKFLCGQMLSIL